jgi:hypothetical protein
MAPAPCRAWTCPGCWKHVRFARGLHLAGLLAEHGGPFYLRRVGPSALRNARVRIKRHSGDYLVIKPPAGDYFLIATAPWPGASSADLPGALVRLGSALAELGQRTKARAGSTPIATSEAWRFSKRPRALPEWKRVGWTRATQPGPVLDVLSRYGLVGHQASENGTEWTVAFALPEGFPKEDKRRLYAELRRLGGVSAFAPAPLSGVTP